ncbi:MAG: transmembrane Fragile-X-F protein [Clostridia bacterium]|nr:transmembrane Fragile-X-F protein [Clostridia bacterium]
MGLCEVLTIIFVICKLLGIVAWSWWIVFLPEIIAVAIYIIIWIFRIARVIKANRWFDKL